MFEICKQQTVPAVFERETWRIIGAARQAVVCRSRQMWLTHFLWLKPCRSRWNVGHITVFSIQLCSVLLLPSSSSCMPILLSTSSQDLFSVSCSLVVSLYLFGMRHQPDRSTDVVSVIAKPVCRSTVPTCVATARQSTFAGGRRRRRTRDDLLVRKSLSLQTFTDRSTRGAMCGRLVRRWIWRVSTPLRYGGASQFDWTRLQSDRWRNWSPHADDVSGNTLPLRRRSAGLTPRSVTRRDRIKHYDASNHGWILCCIRSPPLCNQNLTSTEHKLVLNALCMKWYVT